jgi:Tol biopolymer transport system component
MPLSPGDKFGPFELLAPIGAGGMGEVWKARDTRLDRLVAIKFSKAEFNERFEREARAVAALNHPGICTLHDIGPDYLVMEFVEGKPVSGPLPLAEALRLGILIAEALGAAHRKGIVHRDLKPANILVSKSGVKVLDFGLAKFQQPFAVDQDTMTMALTGKGVILGTLQYISPEQVQGGETDARSDIFSFGLVLYEMITGHCAFRAENAASLIAAILKETPEPVEKLAPVAPALGRLIARALEKDPDRRWQNVRDMALEMESILAAPSEESRAASAQRAGFGWKGVAAAVVLTILACAAVFRVLQDSPDSTIAKTSIKAVAVEPELDVDPIFSPDGKSLVYTRAVGGTLQLFVRPLASQNPLQITEGAGRRYPIAWSADGARLYFVDGQDLKVTGANGGAPQPVMKSVTTKPGYTQAVAVSPDGRALVFARMRPDGKSELAVSFPPGAEARPLAAFTPTSDFPFIVRFSPDGRKLAASVGDELIILPFPEGKPWRIAKPSEGILDLAWLPDSRHIVHSAGLTQGHEVILRDTETSAARVVLRSVEYFSGLNVSLDGVRLAYHSGKNETAIMELAIDSGAVHPLRATPLSETDASYAPSGSEYVYVDYATGRAELMLREIGGDRAVQLTFGNPVAGISPTETRTNPRFSPDGRRIAFAQGGRIWTMPATGGEPVAVTPAGERARWPAWSPDNRWIAYQRGAVDKRELVRVDPASQLPPVVLSPRALRNSGTNSTRWSAAGRIAYHAGDGIRICGEDGSGDHLLAPGSTTGDFNRRGDLFYALKPGGEVAKLLTVEVASGRVVRSVAIEESPAAAVIDLSLHPDGKRMCYTRNENKYDIFVLDGLPRPATGWLRLFRHWE